MDITLRINQLRKEKKISLMELAEKIGFSYVGLQKALKNSDFRISQLEKMAEIFEVPISIFFSDFEDKMLKLFSIKEVKYKTILDQYIQHFYETELIKNFNDPNVQFLLGANSTENEEILDKLVSDIKQKEKFGLNTLSLNEFISLYYDSAFFRSFITDYNENFITKMYSDEIISWFLKNNLISNGQLTTIITEVIIIPRK